MMKKLLKRTILALSRSSNSLSLKAPKRNEDYKHMTPKRTDPELLEVEKAVFELGKEEEIRAAKEKKERKEQEKQDRKSEIAMVLREKNNLLNKTSEKINQIETKKQEDKNTQDPIEEKKQKLQKARKQIKEKFERLDKSPKEKKDEGLKDNPMDQDDEINKMISSSKRYTKKHEVDHLKIKLKMLDDSYKEIAKKTKDKKKLIEIKARIDKIKLSMK